MRKRSINDTEETVFMRYGIDSGKLKGLRVQEYDKGEYISREGQPLDCLFIVLTGKAKVFCDMENGRRLLLSFYKSDGMIGDIELMLGIENASASVQALTVFSCIVIPIGRENKEILRGNLLFLNIVGEILAHKLEHSSKNSAHMILYPLEERLCSYIEVTNQDGIFAEKLTETAEAIGTSYRHLLRELKRLSENGILKKEKNCYRITNAEELRKRSRNFYCPVEGIAYSNFEQTKRKKENKKE